MEGARSNPSSQDDAEWDKTAKGALIIFIDMLTGLWRASGTISALVSLAAGFFTPATLVLMALISCSVVSFLVGTSFGTAATMGVMCATIGQSAGVEPAVLGGAILSGCYFGDRCSPVSSSAYLVATLLGQPHDGLARTRYPTPRSAHPSRASRRTPPFPPVAPWRLAPAT